MVLSLTTIPFSWSFFLCTHACRVSSGQPMSSAAWLTAMSIHSRIGPEHMKSQEPVRHSAPWTKNPSSWRANLLKPSWNALHEPASMCNNQTTVSVPLSPSTFLLVTQQSKISHKTQVYVQTQKRSSFSLFFATIQICSYHCIGSTHWVHCNDRSCGQKASESIRTFKTLPKRHTPCPASPNPWQY